VSDQEYTVSFGPPRFIRPCPSIPYSCRAGLHQFCRRLTGHDGDHDWGHEGGWDCTHGQVDEAKP
jgi:hypothetical protein